MKKIFAILFLLTIIQPTMGQNKLHHNEKGTIVFVHGAWGGGWDYKIMQNLMEAKGYTVYRPTLTGLGEREHLNGPNVNLDTHIMDIVNVIKFEDLHDIILVGHSYGGMVITGVADKIPERIKRIVYVDAFLPEDGESVFSLHTAKEDSADIELARTKGHGWSIPPTWTNVERDVPQPLEAFRQPISLKNPDKDKIPGTYILTMEPGEKTDRFSKFAERAKKKNWDYFELPTGHNAQRTMPNEYAEILSSID